MREGQGTLLVDEGIWQREGCERVVDESTLGNEGVTKGEHYIGIPTAGDIGILEEQLYSAARDRPEIARPPVRLPALLSSFLRAAAKVNASRVNSYPSSYRGE